MHPYRADDARAQVAALERVRAERDAAAVARALGRVEADARSGANVMRAIIEAVKAYASVGEITQRLVGVFGRFVEPMRFDHREEEMLDMSARMDAVQRYLAPTRLVEALAALA